MAMSPSSRMDNLTVDKPLPRAASEGPQRRPLGELTANAIHGRRQLAKDHKVSQLKRSSISILDQDRGLRYLKRRKLSDSDIEDRRNETRKRMQTARFRPLPEEPKQQDPQVTLSSSHRMPLSTNSLQSDDTIVVEKDSPEPAEQSDESHESGVTRASFSSLINYDPSSQIASSAPFPHISKHVPPKALITVRATSHAEMLRLRLRLAMYKIKTNQLYIPFDRLQIYRQAQRRSTQAMLDPALSPASSETPELSSRITAHMETSPDNTPRPSLGPTPVLLPTAFASRLVFGPLLHGPEESRATAAFSEVGRATGIAMKEAHGFGEGTEDTPRVATGQEGHVNTNRSPSTESAGTIEDISMRS